MQVLTQGCEPQFGGRGGHGIGDVGDGDGSVE